METSLRIVLLLLAGGIVAGIIWDAFWSKRGGRRDAENSKSTRPKFSHAADQSLTSEDSSIDSDSYKNSRTSLKTQETAQETKRFQKNPFADNNHFFSESEQDEFIDVILAKPNLNSKEQEENLSESKAINSSSNLNSGLNSASNSNSSTNPSLTSSQSARESSTATNVNKGSYAKDLVVLNIMARQPGVFLGKKLIDAFNEAHLFYGEMNIFHRHEETDGVGRVIFSIASVVEPGMFEISKLETFITPGLTMFFQLGRPNQSIAAFELMLRTAKQLAMRLDAEIKDDQHKYLTLPTIERYREWVRHGHVVVQR